MSGTTRALGLLVAVFAAVGLALGVVGFLTLSWAQTRFVVTAGGASPSQFGPVFVGLVFFQTVGTHLALGPVLSVLLGTLAGSRFPETGRAAAVAGAGTALGSLLMAVLALAVTGLAGVAQGVGFGTALVPIVATAVVGGGAGAAGGAVGASLVR